MTPTVWNPLPNNLRLGSALPTFKKLLVPPTKEEVNVFARVRLSVCLSVSNITQNACMDLDEMLRVDRCRDMDVQNNF